MSAKWVKSASSQPQRALNSLGSELHGVRMRVMRCRSRRIPPGALPIQRGENVSSRHIMFPCQQSPWTSTRRCSGVTYVERLAPPRPGVAWSRRRRRARKSTPWRGRTHGSSGACSLGSIRSNIATATQRAQVFIVHRRRDCARPFEERGVTASWDASAPVTSWAIRRGARMPPEAAAVSAATSATVCWCADSSVSHPFATPRWRRLTARSSRHDADRALNGPAEPCRLRGPTLRRP